MILKNVAHRWGGKIESNMVSRIIYGVLVSILMLDATGAVAKDGNSSSSEVKYAEWKAALQSWEDTLKQVAYITESQLLAMETLVAELQGVAVCQDDLAQPLVKLAGRLVVREQWQILRKILDVLEQMDCNDIDSDYYIGLESYVIYELLAESKLDEVKARLEALETALKKRSDWKEESHEAAILLFLKGRLAEDRNQMLPAIQYFEEAAALCRRLRRYEDEMVAYNRIGGIYLNLKLYDRAKGYFRKCIAGYEDLDLMYRMAQASHNLSIAYLRLDQLDSAQWYADKSMSYYRLENTHLGIAQVYSNLCNIVSEKEDYALALAYADSSIAYCKEIGMGFGIVINLINKANIHLKTKNYAQTVRLLQEVVSYLPTSQMSEEIYLPYHSCNAQAYAHLGQADKAAYHLDKYMEHSDSVTIGEVQALALSMDNSFKEVQAKEKIRALAADLKTTQLQNAVIRLRSGILLLLLVIIIIWVIARRRQYRMEVDLARRKLKELELDLKVEAQGEAFKSIKKRYLESITTDVVGGLKALAPHIPEESRAEVYRMVRDFKASHLLEGVEKVDQKLNNINEAFENRILALHPDLSPTELKLCNLIRLGLTSREIAKIVNRSEKTVTNSRSLIRRKLDIDTNTNLSQYLRQV